MKDKTLTEKIIKKFDADIASAKKNRRQGLFSHDPRWASGYIDGLTDAVNYFKRNEHLMP